jgi:hypothetical protein
MRTTAVRAMQERSDLGPTDVCRESGDVLGKAAAVFARASSFVVLVAVGLLATPARHVVALFVADSAQGLGIHLIVTMAMLLLAVMLGSMLGWRRVLAIGIPVAILSVLEEARRSLIRAGRQGDLAFGLLSKAVRRYRFDEIPSGILLQLRRSLALSPLAPPRLLDRFI